LENSEDCRSAGGHGNQHVRLRSSQIDRIEAILPGSRCNLLLRAAAGARDQNFQNRGVNPTVAAVFSGVDGQELARKLMLAFDDS
jgi:hypothetical protein